MLTVVKVFSERGYGTGMFEIIDEDINHYTLKPITGLIKTTIHLYKIHCYRDRDTRITEIKLREERAMAISHH